jgi:hypothetical protein
MSKDGDESTQIVWARRTKDSVGIDAMFHSKKGQAMSLSLY